MAKPFTKVTNKYGAKHVGHYASKRESEYAAELSQLKAAGKVRAWIEQVPIRLPGGLKFVCDFLVIKSDGSVQLVEIKGMATPAFKMKMRLLQEAQPELFALLEVLA